MLSLLRSRTILQTHCISQDGTWADVLRKEIVGLRALHPKLALTMGLSAIQLASPQKDFNDWFETKLDRGPGYIGTFGHVWVVTDGYLPFNSPQRLLVDGQVEVVVMEDSWQPPDMN